MTLKPRQRKQLINSFDIYKTTGIHSCGSFIENDKANRFSWNLCLCLSGERSKIDFAVQAEEKFIMFSGLSPLRKAASETQCNKSSQLDVRS